MFIGVREKYNEFEHLLLNHLRPHAHKLTEEQKLNYFQSLLRDDAIEFWQILTVTTETTLKDILAAFKKEYAKEELTEVSKFKFDQLRYDPTTESFSTFLANNKKVAEQAYGDKAQETVKTFLFAKLPIQLQNELAIAGKHDASIEEIKTFVQRRWQYAQLLPNQQLLQPFNQAVQTKEAPSEPVQTNPLSPPCSTSGRIPSPGFQSPNCKREHCPGPKQVLLRVFIGGNVFEETFMILPTMGNILIGMFFLEKYSVTLDLTNNVVKFPNITLQLKPERGRYKIQMIELRTTQMTVIQPDHQLIVPVLSERDLGTIQGTVETFPAFERKTQLLVSPALAQIAEMKNHVQITNLTSHTIMLNPNTTVATFRKMTPNQAKKLQPMSNEQLTLITKYPDEATNVLNQLFQEPDTNTDRRWYPTPETSDDPSKLNRIENGYTTKSPNFVRKKN